MTPPASIDIEVLAFVDDPALLMEVLTREVGPWTSEPSPSDAMARYERGSVVLILQPGRDNSWSVWLRGSDRWPHAAALGRYLVHALGCDIWCEPDPSYNIPSVADVVLRITATGEALIAGE